MKRSGFKRKRYDWKPKVKPLGFSGRTGQLRRSKCAVCGAALRQGTRFCSYTCAASARRKRVNKTCQQCGTAFEVHPCRVGKACSDKCARLLRRTRVARTCLNCGAEFTTAPSQFKYHKGAGRYCSKHCANQGRIKEAAKRPEGKRYARRHADREWQRAVRERDNFTCQRCGKQEKYIHAHHVAPRSIRPDLIHDVNNGKCLCAFCHLWCHYHPIEARELGLLSNDAYERNKRPKNYCTVCGERAFGHGFCLKHYKRFQKYGDPLLTKRHGGGRYGEIVRVAPDVSMR